MSSLGTDKSVWRVGFDTNGDHVSRNRQHASQQPADTRFLGTLVYKGYSTTRSSAEVVLKDNVTSRHYLMSLAEFMAIVPLMREGELSGEWGFKKNGTSTTLAWIDPNSLDSMRPF
jgi:hypothetical protein